MKASAETRPADAAMQALATALAPLVAEILLARSSANDGDEALRELLERAGYEVDEIGVSP